VRSIPSGIFYQREGGVKLLVFGMGTHPQPKQYKSKITQQEVLSMGFVSVMLPEEKANSILKATVLGLGLLLLVVVLTGLSINLVTAEELSGEEIMAQVDENQFRASARAEEKLIIRDGDRETTKEMISYMRSDGETTEALAEFVNPRDRGTKYLLLDDELWMYFPDAEELVKVSGHMLEEGMMGSDFSYQDALEMEQLTDLYEFELEEEDTFNDRPVYVIKATARQDREPAYHSRWFWIDQERYVVLLDEMYARDGRLLREMVTEEVEEIQEGRWMPTEMVMEDKLREDTETIYRLTEIELDYDIPEDKLSLEALQ